MRYLEYAKLCRQGQSWAGNEVFVPDLNLVKRSEMYILSGNAESARATIADITDPRAAYLQAVKASRHFEDDSFMDGLELPAALTPDWLLPLLRGACSVAGNDGDGERLERYIANAPETVGPDAIKAFAIVSNAYRNANNLGASRRVLLEAFQLTPRVKESGVNVPRAGADLLFARRRQTAFHDLLRVASFHQRSIFPCSGTLLGLYRDKDFIPSDGDVDLGCLDPTGFQALKEDMRKSGRFYLSPGRMGSNFNARHVDGPKLDVSLYVPREQGWAKTSHVYEWRFDKFSLGELATDYGRLPVPDAAEDYLSAMYEDWWVPQSGYDSRIDSPNLVYVSPEEVVIVMANHFLAAYLQGGAAACVSWKRKFERLPGEVRSDMGRFTACLS